MNRKNRVLVARNFLLAPFSYLLPTALSLLFFSLSTIFYLLPTSVYGESFACAGDPKARIEGLGKVAYIEPKGKKKVLAIFAKFKGEAPADSLAPSFANDIFDPNRQGSFSHFYEKMSSGALEAAGTVLRKRYQSDFPAQEYVIAPERQLGKFDQFNLEILSKVDNDIDFGEFDNDGPDNIPNSGDDDGFVDFVTINLRSRPTGFFIGTATGIASLGFKNDFITNDTKSGGGFIKVPGIFTAMGGTTQRVRNFASTAGTIAHEFAHVFGLPDLFDQTFLSNPNLDLQDDGAGIGNWGMMGRGTLGWSGTDGPNPFSAWCKEQLGWIGRENDNLVVVQETMRNVVISDSEMGGKVYKIHISNEEYFLVENRQKSGGYYDRNIPGGGIFIWHVDMTADNDEERHKQVDLECADGLLKAGSEDPSSGADQLDRWSRDADFAEANDGNLGDATDPFDGIAFTSFDSESNPSSNAYGGFGQTISTGIAVENIRKSGNDMIVDFMIGSPAPGRISQDTTWSGTVNVPGDVIVDFGATLAIASGTQVGISKGDVRKSGVDPDRCELIIYGRLLLEGNPSNPINLASLSLFPSETDWYGIRLINDQKDINRAGVVIEGSEFGFVRQRLPEDATWSGTVIVPEDMTIPEGTTLTVSAGTTVRFADRDWAGRGADPLRCELIVEGSLIASGTSASGVLFTSMLSQIRDADQAWGGIKLVPGGVLDMSFTLLQFPAFALTGELKGAQAYLRDSIIRSTPGGGISLRISDGTLNLERTTIEQNGASGGINVSGTGSVVLKDCTIRNNVGVGLSTDNCSVQAEGCTFSGNGDIQSALGNINLQNRSGVEGSAGEDHIIDLRDCLIERNAKEGIDLSEWSGQVHISDSIIRDNREVGLSLSETSGEIVRSLFADPTGIELRDVASLDIEENTFTFNQIGIASISSSPRITYNTFREASTALRIEGGRIPERIRRNSFLGNNISVQNLTFREVNAEGNLWGTVILEEIAAQIQGSVDFEPFLASEPLLGDFDGDSQVGLSDFVLFLDAFATTASSTDWDPLFDLDDNGEVGLSDFVIFLENFGTA